MADNFANNGCNNSEVRQRKRPKDWSNTKVSWLLKAAMRLAKAGARAAVNLCGNISRAPKCVHTVTNVDEGNVSTWGSNWSASALVIM